jgi:hypothetical protein
MYLLMIVGFRFLVVFFFRVQPALAWTLTNVFHAVATFMSFHWNKGLPYSDTVLQTGDVAGLTAWEQWSRHPSTFVARQFLTAIPVVLFIVTVTVNRNLPDGGNDTHLLINTVATALVVIAKLDVMYKVRVFGINREETEE